jgi:hypothetical protein
MGNAIISSIVGQTRRSAELAAAAYIIDKMFKGLDIPVQVPDTDRIIRFEGNSINIRILLAYKYVVRSLCLRFVFRGPQGSIEYEGIIDTGAEVNILSEKLSRSIGRVVYNTTDYRISTTTRAEFGFAGMVKLRAEVADRIGYKDTFFLVKGAPKILLG